MGLDTYVHLVIGQRVSREQLFNKVIGEDFVPNSICDNHPTIEEAGAVSMHYCPDCGNNLYRKTINWESRFPEYIEKPWWDIDEPSFGEFHILKGTDGDDYYIGFINYDYCNHRGGPYEVMKPSSWLPGKLETTNLKGFLEKLGLHDEEKFGVWTVMVVSY